MRSHARRSWIGLLATLALLSACGGSTAAKSTIASGPQHTLIVAEDIGSAITLDPNQAFETVDVPVDHELYSNLVTYQGNNASTVVPELATSWAISDNNMVYTFQLRKGVKFSNGDALTASDVVYSFERAVNLTNSPAEYLVGTLGLTSANVASLVTAPSSYVFRLQLGSALAPGAVLAILTYPTTAVVDAKVVQREGSDYGHAWLTNHSAGSGPYELNNWTADSQIVLTANPNYTLGPTPDITKVIYTEVSTSTAQLDTLEHGGADMATLLTPSQLTQLDQTGKFKTLNIPQVAVVYLGLNTTYGPQANPLVRQAIHYAINYQQLITDVLQGQGTADQSIIPNGLYGHDADMPYSYDITKAKALMTQAGYPNGYSVTLSTFASSLPGAGAVAPGDLATFIQTELAQIGITVNIQLLQSSALVSAFRGGQTEMAMVPFNEDYPDPSDFTGPFGIFSDGGVSSFLHWNSSEAASLAQQSSTLPNGPARLAALTQFQQYVLSQGPYVVLFQPTQQWGVSTSLSDIYVNNPLLGPQLEAIQKS